MAGIKRERSRSRSPVRRSGGERRPVQRDRNVSNRSGFNQHSDKMVYFSNLPYEMTWMELKDLVREKAGEVNFIETIDGRDGRPTGCAVVEFKNRDSTIKCVENMHRQEIRGRNIIAKEIRLDMYKNTSITNVRNFDLRQTSLNIHYLKTPLFNGFCRSQQSVPDPAIFFRKIREDTGVDFLGSRDRQPSRASSNLPRRTSSSINDNETFGLSPAFLSQLNVKLPLVDRIFITNISFGCGVGRLFDICSLAGKIVWFDLQLDPDGKSKGMAICQYSHPIEAVQAISMLNGQRIYDRTITVKMDRYEKEAERREGELPAGLRGIGMGLGANGAPLADVASVISSISSSAVAVNPVIQPSQSLSLLGAQLASNPFGVNSVIPSAAHTAATLNPSYALQQQLQQQQQQQQQLIQPFGNGAGDHHSANSLLGAHSFGVLGGGGTGYSSAQPASHQSAPSFFGSTVTGSGHSSGSLAPTSAPSNLFNNKAVNGSAFNGPTSLMGGGGASGGNQGSAGRHYSSSALNQSSSSAGGNSYDNQSSRVILIKNLPMDYTWQIVSDRVQQFGDLESVEMVSPGVAKVRFIQITDAERAKQTLQGTTVEGRIIGIEYL